MPPGSLGIDYPVAVDDNLATWDAYNNEYWPADYLIDPTGVVRAYDFGEGGYGTMESNIRMLLSANGVSDLPPRTDVPDKTPTDQSITPESYVGYQRLDNEVGTSVEPDKTVVYHPPASIPSNSLAFGGTWTVHSEEATAGSNATLGLQFTANDVYLVMSGQGTVGVSLQRAPRDDACMSVEFRSCTRCSRAPSATSGVLTLTVSPGVEAYDFTFG